MKRLFDFSLSVVLIIFLTPLFLFVVILLSLTGEHCVFYKQKRSGYKGKEFMLIKFVTMLKNSHNLGSKYVVIPNDPRVLPLGKFLRKSKIDEIPQLLNVLKGDMSFVGPRPTIPKFYNYYSNRDKAIICKMKPGITGVTAIIFRDEESILSKNEVLTDECVKQTIMPYKAELEKWYFNNKNFVTDTLLILITIWVLFDKHSNIAYKFFKDLPRRSI